ncbi:hypothetical protein PSAB6_60344 [Paraburkholderia sabiae]|nr:hypothetical protein PSAB6_60344 [Paraburkholderia sabiae]
MIFDMMVFLSTLRSGLEKCLYLNVAGHYDDVVVATIHDIHRSGAERAPLGITRGRRAFTPRSHCGRQDQTCTGLAS